jgi:cytochrome c oxidase accessory protein FixG
MSSDPESVEIFDAEAVNAKENRKLYAERKKVFPKRGYGTFRTLKWWVMLVTLGIYYITPWLRWDRGEYAPDQAVLLDLAHRRFYFFFIEIWPQEFYYVAGMLVMAGITLFLVTSTIGRAWCGYTCWQTVWVDLFLVVERFVEGDRNARMKLDKAPWNREKISKMLIKHIGWLFIAFATGGAWILYFADAPTLFVNFFTGQSPFVAYATVAVLTFMTYTFAGFMREQVCTYMCPWPRIQAAMLDEDSLTVTYNDWRGEPRNRKAKRAIAAGETVGDCVDCNACVAVCPMGIDIRHGQQLECISCALCIDACDAVMKKLGKAHGLVSYATLRDYNANMAVATDGSGKMDEINPVTMIDITAMAAEKSKKAMTANYDQSRVDRLAHTSMKSIFRPRTILYSSILGTIALSLMLVLVTRSRLDINVLHDRNPIFIKLSDGSIRNGFQIKVLNMIAKPRKFNLAVEGLPGVTITFADSDKKYGDNFDVDVKPDKLRAMKVFLSMPRGSLKQMHTNFRIHVTEIDGEENSSYDAKFEAPKEAVK